MDLKIEFEFLKNDFYYSSFDMNLFDLRVTDTSGRYDVIRVFLWARNRVEGGKDPGAFVIATCELAGHILIYDKDEYDNMDLKRVAKAQRESCDETFNEVKPKVLELLQRLSSSKYKYRDEM